MIIDCFFINKFSFDAKTLENCRYKITGFGQGEKIYSIKFVMVLSIIYV